MTDRMRVNRVARVGRVGLSPPLLAAPVAGLVLTATTLRITFSRAVTVSDVSGVSVAVDGGDSPVLSVAGSGTAALTYTLDGSTPILTGNAVRFAYDANTGDLADAATAVRLPDINNFVVTNPL